MSIAISLSPNTTFKDALLAIKLLLKPWQWQKGKKIIMVEEWLKNYLGVKEVVAFASGRQSLLAILKCLNLKKEGEVLLQSYTCVVVANSIIASGAKPIYVEINPDTFNMDLDDLMRKITPQSKVLIVQHTFGQPDEMETIQKICQENHLILIEDCAHALGAEYQSRKVGAFGQASFFSFGRDKIISSVFGGAVATNDQQLAKKLKKLKNQAPYPSKFWLFQQLLHPIIFHLLILPFYFFFSLGKIILISCQQLHFLSKAVSFKEKMGQFPNKIYRYSNALACLCLAQLNSLETMNHRRRQIAQLYSKELFKLPIKLPKVKKNCRHIFLRFTIRVPQARQLIAFAKKHQILLGDWYRSVIAPRGVDLKSVFYQPGSCPQAEQAAQESVNLPTYPRMTLKEAKRVIKVVKKFCNSEL